MQLYEKYCIIIKCGDVGSSALIVEQYRSGHNGHDWKSCDGRKPSVSSNLTCSANNKRPPSGGLLLFRWRAGGILRERPREGEKASGEQYKIGTSASGDEAEARLSKKWLNATFSSFFHPVLAPMARPAPNAGKALLRKRFLRICRTPPQGALSCPCGAIHLVSPNPN